MAIVPVPSITSETNLNLGQVPSGIEDSAIYEALVNIHDALNLFLTDSDAADAVFSEYITKQRAIKIVAVDYTILITDGTILVKADAAPVIITLPPAKDGPGYQYDIVCIDNTYKVTVVGDGVEPISTHTAGIELNVLDSITVKSHADDDEYWII